MLKWSKLLSAERLGGKIVIDSYTEKRYPRSDFEKDYRRIMECASFRRLQDKTQVFPLDQSDFVRTRLTHSYETSVLAKTLGAMLLTVIGRKREEGIRKKKGNCQLDEQDIAAIEHIPDILTCAGLLHDIGNPPFGHFGEEVIKKWFTCHLKDFFIVPGGLDTGKGPQMEESLEVLLDGPLKMDLTHFDGNAQALRVLTKLHFQDSDYGLNLTSAVLNTLVKYPSASSEVKKKGDTGYSLFTKKMGYTEADRAAYERITAFTGAKNCRHPLAFALEAADDTAYKTADIEDGFKKGLFSLDEFLNFVESRISEYQQKYPDNKTISYVEELFNKLDAFRLYALGNPHQKGIPDFDLYAVQNWIPYAQEWLLYCAAYGFERHYDEIMAGDYAQDLFYDTNHGISVQIIDDIMGEFIYPNRGIVKLELAADTILSNLLEKFTTAVLYHDGKFRSERYVEIQAYQKLYDLISENYREAYRLALSQYPASGLSERHIPEDFYDLYLRLLLVTDYISGMTDSYAKSLYQELNGIYGLSGIY